MTKSTPDETAAPGLTPGARIARLLQQTKGARLVIAPDAVTAQAVLDEIRFFAPGEDVRFFPDTETLAYDALSPHKELVSDRIALLQSLADGTAAPCVVTTVTTACARLAPKNFYLGRVFHYRVGEKVDREALRARLVASGYEHVSQVVAPGEFAVRGSVFDIFAAGANEPVRLDFFDEEIEAIYAFDAETQRSTAKLGQVGIIPGKEFPTDEASLAGFRSRWRKRFAGDPARFKIYRDMTQGVIAPGIEYYLPLFFEETALLADFFPEGAPVHMLEGCASALEDFAAETRSRYRFLCADAARSLLTPEELFAFSPDFEAGFARLSVRLEEPAPEPPEVIGIDRRNEKTFSAFEKFLKDSVQGGRRVLVVLPSQGRLEIFAGLARRAGLPVPVVSDFEAFRRDNTLYALTTGEIVAGCVCADIVVLTERELFARNLANLRTRRAKTTNVERVVRNLSELAVGDAVVHVKHGVGRYAGLETIRSASGAADFVRIDYAAGAKLFLPVTQLGLLSRYSASSDKDPPLNHLGRGEFDKIRAKGAIKAHDTAAELLHLYAQREAKPGIAMQVDAQEYERFASLFSFEETPDQAQAIQAVVDDLQKPRPMDRLICGDVGFGKTEVAVRAAFIAVMNGYQVAVLCPTTLLAEQHHATFAERFRNYPVTIASLSRFRSANQTKETLEGIAAGSVDIVIGTHKLITGEVKFARLALLVIDEEHRFGVRQKEKIKARKTDLHVLTLTATPIPRTLTMSLEGIRDFSVIATAPEKRLSIKTILNEESPGVIREAILRELRRGGQVYFLHNDVATIEDRRLRLEKLVPEARFGVAHGQMRERDLEEVMRAFYAHRLDVLVSSSIIENGLDVPNANTIVIARADRFGLAQLHQIRGRVGRSRHQAYAYLLVESLEGLTPAAQKRLEALRELEDLGSGFYLAMHDMEIRGAGEVLGEEQSGQIEAMGYELYNRMLKNAVKALKEGKDFEEAPFEAMTEINLHAPVLIPEDYVADVRERLAFYKELAACETFEAIEEVREALADRYGRLPEPTNTLVDLHRIRLMAQAIGIARIDATEHAVHIAFEPRPRIDPARIIAFVQAHRDMLLNRDLVLKITREMPEPSARVAEITALLRAIDAP